MTSLLIFRLRTRPLLVNLRKATPLFSCSGNGFRWASLLSRSFASSQQRESTSGKSPRAPFKWYGVILLIGMGLPAIYYVRHSMKQTDEKIAEERKKLKGSVGKALIGGPWELVNFDNKLKSWTDYLGRWIVIYFGFTHCPDICPEELEKLCNIVDALDKDENYPSITPLFFTVDPIRDTPENIKKYCLEYSPKLEGFSGSIEQVSKVCKAFRVYFSEGQKDVDQDYIMDHSIIMYLIDPEGNYVEHYSRETPERLMLSKIRQQMKKYQEKTSK